MGIKHTFVSAIPDAGDTTRVRPTNWNADHTIDGDVDFNGYAVVNADLGVVGGESVLTDWVTPMQYGAVADGSSHPLSEFYSSLAEAQAAYNGAFNFITSLTQTIDYAASKAAANECFGPDTVLDTGDFAINGTIGDWEFTDRADTFLVETAGQSFAVDELVGQTLFLKLVSTVILSGPITTNTADTITATTGTAPTAFTTQWALGYGEHGEASNLNKVLYFPAGYYEFGADGLLIRDLRSGCILGAGKLNSKLTADTCPLAFDGIWYTTISNIHFQVGIGGTNTAALELDGNVPGHPYDTRGVQSVTVQDCLMDGGDGDYAMTVCRQGSGNGQGSECLYLNCHLSGASEACYYQNGFNALANSFIGGNFQNYTKHGIYVVGGTCAVFNTGFQSTHYYTQILNAGHDIRCGDAGAFEGFPIIGCRSESWAFLHNEGSVRTYVSNCAINVAGDGWSATTTFGPNHASESRLAIFVNAQADTAAGTNKSRVFVAQTDGISGGVEPTWPIDGTPVVDGTVTWQEDTTFYSIYVGTGQVEWQTMNGPTHGNKRCPGPRIIESADTTGFRANHITNYIDVDSTAGAMEIWLPELGNGLGNMVTIRKRENDTNTVTIKSTVANFANPTDGSATASISFADPLGFITLVYAEGSGGALWCPIATSRAYGNHSAIGAETVTGYLTMRDAGGTLRKIAVVS